MDRVIMGYRIRRRTVGPHFKSHYASRSFLARSGPTPAPFYSISRDGRLIDTALTFAKARHLAICYALGVLEERGGGNRLDPEVENVA